MIKPVNGHLLIDPVKHETFVASQRDTFQEIGVITGLPADRPLLMPGVETQPAVGDKVYFDSWLAAKFPKNDTEHYWLVKWEDVRAVEPQHVEPTIPK